MTHTEFTFAGATIGTATSTTWFPDGLVSGTWPNFVDWGDGAASVGFNGQAIIKSSVSGSTKYLSMTMRVKTPASLASAVEAMQFRNASSKIGSLLFNVSGGNLYIQPRGGGDVQLCSYIAAWSTEYVITYTMQVDTTSTGSAKAQILAADGTTVLASGERTTLNNGTANASFIQFGQLTATTNAWTLRSMTVDDTAYAYVAEPTLGSALTATIADAIGITDAVTEALDEAVDRTDPLGLTDAVTATLGLGRQVADAAGLSDVVAAVNDRTRALADTAGIADAATTTAARHRAPGDALGVTDTAAASAARHRAPTDPIGVTDALTVTWTRVATIGDTLGATDAAAQNSGGHAAMADTLGLTDAPDATATRARHVADTAGITDTLTIVWTRAAALSDVLGIMDAADAATHGPYTPAAVVARIVAARTHTRTVAARDHTRIVPARTHTREVT